MTKNWTDCSEFKHVEGAANLASLYSDACEFEIPLHADGYEGKIACLEVSSLEMVVQDARRVNEQTVALMAEIERLRGLGYLALAFADKGFRKAYDAIRQFCPC